MPLNRQGRPDGQSAPKSPVAELKRSTISESPANGMSEVLITEQIGNQQTRTISMHEAAKSPGRVGPWKKRGLEDLDSDTFRKGTEGILAKQRCLPRVRVRRGRHLREQGYNRASRLRSIQMVTSKSNRRLEDLRGNGMDIESLSTDRPHRLSTEYFYCV